MKILDGTDWQPHQCHTVNVTVYSGIATTVRWSVTRQVRHFSYRWFGVLRKLPLLASSVIPITKMSLMLHWRHRSLCTLQWPSGRKNFRGAEIASQPFKKCLWLYTRNLELAVAH